MTHFNHEWDTTKTPAVPVSVGDRYYAQDLNDDFNYLKHLPYEVFLQGRSSGVIIPPTDTSGNNNSITFSGGFGAVALETPTLDPNEGFTIPPKTETSRRYERVMFADATIILPQDSTLNYIVATPTKRSFLQRAKAIFAEQYASRVQYDGVITIQNTAPTADQILIGLTFNTSCLLCVSPTADGQGYNFKRWYNPLYTTEMKNALNTHYNVQSNDFHNGVLRGALSDDGEQYCHFYNCYNDNTITIKSTNTYFTNCNLRNIKTAYNGNAHNCTFENCRIEVREIYNSYEGKFAYNSTFIRCNIICAGIAHIGVRLFDTCILRHCVVSVGYINENTNDSGDGVIFQNCETLFCDVSVGDVSGFFDIFTGTHVAFVYDGQNKIQYCTVRVGSIGLSNYTVNGFIADVANNSVYFVRAICDGHNPTYSNIVGKGFVVNDTTVKGF